MPGALQDLQFTPDGTGWVFGRAQLPLDPSGFRIQAGPLYRSADQGRSWTAVALPEPAAGRATGLQFVDDRVGFLQAFTRCPSTRYDPCRQQAYATRDAGVTWQAGATSGPPPTACG